MDSTGPIALLGGLEHRRGTEAIERAVLELVGSPAPQVTVIPVASAPRQVGMTAALARTYWTRLGASVHIAMPDADRLRDALEAVSQADVVVLTGGVPNRLVSALGASPLWELVVERWRDGIALVGSSAGAMSLFAWRLRLYPPHPLDLVPGLGPLDGYVAAPHFSRFRAARWAPPLTHRFGGLELLGVDEGTAVVGRADRFRVVGNGAVSLVEQGQMVTYPPGATVPLDLQITPARTGPTLVPAAA